MDFHPTVRISVDLDQFLRKRYADERRDTLNQFLLRSRKPFKTTCHVRRNDGHICRRLVQFGADFEDQLQRKSGATQGWQNRNGLDGRNAGTVPNFDYSDANKNSGIVWNEETFEDYIRNPAAKIPDAKMTFAGVKNEQQVKDLWAYINQFDADGNIKK